MNADELAVTIEALREYRLRVNAISDRRYTIDQLIIKLITQLAEAQ